MASEIKTQEAPIQSELDIDIRGLVKTTTELHDEIYGKSSQRPHALWMVRISNFLSAYSKANNPNGFKKMFNDFYSVHTQELCQDIFIEQDEQTIVNDKWLRVKDNLEQKSSVKKSSSDSWAPSQATCKGLVIYFDPQRKSVSIPISEIYIAATSYAKEKGTSDLHAYSYPGRILYHLFSILHHSIPELDPTRQKITNNMIAIKSFLNEITTPNESSRTPAPNDLIGEGLSGFTKIMSTVMKSAGLDMNIDASQLESTMRNTFNGDTVKSMGKVVNKIIDSVKDSKSNDLNSVMDGIGEAFKDPEIRNMLSSSARETAALVSSIPSLDNAQGSEIPITPSEPVPVEVVNPEKQD